MSITYGDHLIDIGANEMTVEQEREVEAREECTRRGIDPDEICADGGVTAWMVVDQERMNRPAAIDRLDVKAEAKSLEPDAVAWLRNGSCDGSIPFALCDEDDEGAFPVYAHPTTKPEAPAVSVDAIKDLIRTHVTVSEAATAIAALIAGER